MTIQVASELNEIVNALVSYFVDCSAEIIPKFTSISILLQFSFRSAAIQPIPTPQRQHVSFKISDLGCHFHFSETEALPQNEYIPVSEHHYITVSLDFTLMMFSWLTLIIAP